MRETETAASFAIALAKSRDLEEVSPDELLLGCLRALSQFGIVRIGAAIIDLEELNVDWLESVDKGAAKVSYSDCVVALFDQAAQIARTDGAAPVGLNHLLAAFAREESGLMGELKRKYGITSASWRAGLAELETARLIDAKESAAEAGAARDYLTPEEAAETLGIHVQTLRGYVRSGKLPALRLAGERAIRIRRRDLETVLEPLVPQT